MRLLASGLTIFGQWLLQARQRREALPSIVIDTCEPQGVDDMSVPNFWLHPSGSTGGIVAGIALGTTPADSGPSLGRVPWREPLQRILLRIRNASGMTSVGLRVPLQISFSHLGTNKERPAAPETLGLQHESVTHKVELTIPLLERGRIPSVHPQ